MNTCKFCKGPISKERGTSVYCSKNCQARYAYKLRQRRSLGVTAPEDVHNCDVCGKSFVDSNPGRGRRKVYCSDECRNNAYRSVKNESTNLRNLDIEWDPELKDWTFWCHIWKDLGLGDFKPTQTKRSFKEPEDFEEGDFAPPQELVGVFEIDNFKGSRARNPRPFFPYPVSDCIEHQGETVEQYLARGGKITVLPPAVSWGSREGLDLGERNDLEDLEGSYLSAMGAGKMNQDLRRQLKNFLVSVRRGVPRSHDTVRGQDPRPVTAQLERPLLDAA